MQQVVLFIVIGLLAYTIVPTLLVRLWGIGVYKQSAARHAVALTFDDGPDAEYTPRLLDLLKTYQVKATFFVLGSKAEKHPELIERMHRDGHLIGVHNYVHWANALMTPGKVRRGLDHSVDAVSRIIGEKPIYYRPPWGVINLFDFFLLKRFRMILWSVIVSDWRSSGGKEKIKRKLLSRLKGGAVIVLHDSGQTFGADEDAPAYMLEALDEFIAEAQARGYAFLRVDESMALDERADTARLSPFKRMLIRLWLQWDRMFHALFEVKPVDQHNSLLFYRVTVFRGQDIALSDEEKLVTGDRVIELHFNNASLLRMGLACRSPIRLAVMIVRSVKEALPQITDKLENDPECRNVKAVYGITMIHRGAAQLGFKTMALPRGMLSAVTKIYLKLLMMIIHPDGSKRLKLKSEALIPKVLAISAKELNKNYPAPALTLD